MCVDKNWTRKHQLGFLWQSSEFETMCVRTIQGPKPSVESCCRVPMPFEVETKLTAYKKEKGITWQSAGHQSQLSGFLKSHAEFGGIFPEWRLLEAARSARGLLTKKTGLWEAFRAMAKDRCFD